MAKEMTFTIPANLVKKFDKWRDSLPKKDLKTIGGRYTFEFTPTGVGTLIWVIDEDTDAAIDLTKDEDW